jgi:hypothetical protein
MTQRHHELLQQSIKLLEEVRAENIKYRFGAKHIVLSAIYLGRQINTTLSKSPHSSDWRLARNHIMQLRRKLRAIEGTRG